VAISRDGHTASLDVVSPGILLRKVVQILLVAGGSPEA